MRAVKPIVATVLTVAAVLVVAQPNGVVSKRNSRQAASRPQLQMHHLPRPERFHPRGALANEDRAGVDEAQMRLDGMFGESRPSRDASVTEAPTGFDNLTNGFLQQGPPYESLNEDNVVALRSFNDNRFIFEEVETAADGLGPTYNAQSCRECHQNVVTGGASQVAEHRTGTCRNGPVLRVARRIADPVARHSPGCRWSWSHSRTTFARSAFQPTRSAMASSKRSPTRRCSRFATLSPPRMRGTAVMVPVLEANGAPRIGRFGWKDQHASLESFAADAYLNEMGITSPLFPGRKHRRAASWIRHALRHVAEPEDDGVDVDGLRRLHASHEGAAARPHHRGRESRASTLFSKNRMRGLPHSVYHDRAPRARKSTAARSRCRRAWQ